MNVLSIDCATKTLGYVYAKINLDYFNNLIELNSNMLKYNNVYDKMEIMNSYNEKFIDIIDSGVKDLLNGKKIKEVSYVQRLHLLYEFMESLNINENSYILLEDQWNLNSQSNVITSAIVMYYTQKGYPVDKIVIISPTKKNKISFHQDLTHASMKLKYPNNTKYNRRKRAKKHTEENFKYYLTHFNLMDNIANIKNANLEHIADAFMQMYYFCLQKMKLI